ncbi:aromatic-ring-hydroxylating dioxygenase subunit beta [Marinicaulis aureus]|uniref:Aromatic-ring-hydroxylating dioxygenase subunit beta n=1 Tax=Hyphococcus aureus TaxID=2666033 RepID=A0ABW1KV58_9PROT
MISVEDRLQVEAFLYKEARLADESRYSEWEALVDDDMHYWIPLQEFQEPDSDQVSILNDNRTRLATRIRQLNTGVRHAQLPPSRMRRLISNIEIEKAENGEFFVGSNVVLYEFRRQATKELEVWPARVEHKLRWKDGGLKMFSKHIFLLNSEGSVRGLSFII